MQGLKKVKEEEEKEGEKGRWPTSRQHFQMRHFEYRKTTHLHNYAIYWANCHTHSYRTHTLTHTLIHTHNEMLLGKVKFLANSPQSFGHSQQSFDISLSFSTEIYCLSFPNNICICSTQKSPPRTTLHHTAPHTKQHTNHLVFHKFNSKFNENISNTKCELRVK